ncbi:MAG: hypothetical protein EP344_08665 [Bacteroidetes bacterium]|nr:MAG: hypothetical protein EP344_08665 [Bacteroidota bacterium]
METVAHREEDRTKAILVSVILHAILLALLFFLHISVREEVLESPPIVIEWGGGGENAAAGLPDVGQGDSPADVGQQLDSPDPEPVSEPEPTPPSASAPPPSSSTPASTSSPTTDDPNAAALRRQQEDARRKQLEDQRRRKEEADRKAELERQRQAELERQRQEQEEQARKKSKFGSNFGKPGATGGGEGNTGTAGNQGQTSGTGTNPFGRNNGTGTGGQGGGDGSGVGESIGGGLGGRKVVGRPSMVDDTQKTGRVTVRVCVNSSGSVTSATYTQMGSTTTDSVLRNKAISWAKQYRFAASSTPEQCGTISFDFQVK